MKDQGLNQLNIKNLHKKCFLKTQPDEVGNGYEWTIYKSENPGLPVKTEA